MACAAGPDVSESGLVLALDAADRYSFTLTSVEVLVVAGGGGGGMDMGGGGGGGGVIYNPNVTVTPGSAVTVTVGAGGAGAPAAGTNGQPGGHQYTISATNGGNSVFGALTAIGGGAGGSSYWGYLPNYGYGNAGGSGGGASGYSDGNTGRGGSGTSGQGFAGGGGGGQYYSGGGGGAGGAGVSGPNKPNGGPGVLYPSMSPYYFGGGGGGASYSLSVGGDGGIGGGGGGALGTTYGGAGLNNGSPGGGGGPNQWANTPGGNAGANTGGGGGGGAHYNSNNKGGDGGSGIVIVRYPGPQRAIGGTVTTVAGHTIHTFTTVGSTTFTPLVATNNSTILGLSDLSNRGNFGTTVNSPVYSSANGGSVSFDGTNDYVTLSSSQIAPGTGAFTWNFWVKLNDLANFSIVFSGTGSNTDYGVIFMDPRNGTGGLGYYALGTRISDNNTTFGSNWWCITFVGSGGANGSRNLKLYRNAIQAGSTYTFDYNFTSTTPNIGANHSSYAELMRGNISNVSHYNRALTAAEISQNFNALRGRFGI